MQPKRLFAEQGFRAISMRQIADAVGISKAAIYYHFKDKEELFLAILESYLSDLATLIDEAAHQGDTCRAKVRAVVLRILTQPAEQRAVLRLASQELSNIEPREPGAFPGPVS